MAELRQDPHFVAREKEREEQQRANRETYAGAAAPVLGELRRAGFAVDSVGALRRGGEYARAVPVLLKWLPQIADRYVKEDIVRTLSVPWARPTAAPALIAELKGSSDDAMRWIIASALEVVADESSFEDLRTLLEEKALGRAREMLVLAVGNLKNPQVQPLLLSLLSEHELAGHVLIALQRSGAQVSTDLITPFERDPRDWVRSEARKLLQQLKRA